MGVNIKALKTELVVGHPDTGAYNADNQLAADEINTVNRNSSSDARTILNYLLLEVYKTNTGTDTASLPLWGRLEMVAAAVDGSDPFGSGTNTVDLRQIGMAKALVRLLGFDLSFSLDLNDTRFDTMLQSLKAAEVMGVSDMNAIKAFSNNKQSRATELGFSKVKLGHITEARA